MMILSNILDFFYKIGLVKYIYEFFGINHNNMKLRRSPDDMKKERNDSFLYFWYKITNINNLGALLISGVLGLISSWSTIYFASQDNTVVAWKIAAWLTTIITGICVKIFMDKIAKIRDSEKLESKGLSAVNNLDAILSNLLKIKKDHSIDEIEYTQNLVINAIDDWEDILPNLQYRPTVNKIREYDRQIDDLKNSADKKDEEIKKLRINIEDLINKAKDYNLNSIPEYSGGTATNLYIR